MRGLHKTDIEIKMEQILEELKIDAVMQFPIRSKYGYIADFAIPELKIIIECDGEHWHKIGNAHDRKRDGFLKSRGWKILRFRGNQIKNEEDYCKKKILESMNHV